MPSAKSMLTTAVIAIAAVMLVKKIPAINNFVGL